MTGRRPECAPPSRFCGRLAWALIPGGQGAMESVMYEVPVDRSIPADSDGRGPAEDKSLADGDRTEQALVRALAELDDLNRRIREPHRRVGRLPTHPSSVQRPTR